MQTFSQFHFSIIPSKQISETVYQELKNKIEKIGNTTEKFCKYYDIKQMYFAELISPDMFITSYFSYGEIYIGIYDKRNNILLDKCDEITLQSLTQNRTNLFLYRIEAFCKNKEKYTNMQNSRLNMIWEEHLTKNIYDNIDL